MNSVSKLIEDKNLDGAVDPQAASIIISRDLAMFVYDNASEDIANVQADNDDDGVASILRRDDTYIVAAYDIKSGLVAATTSIGAAATLYETIVSAIKQSDEDELDAQKGTN